MAEAKSPGELPWLPSHLPLVSVLFVWRIGLLACSLLESTAVNFFHVNLVIVTKIYFIEGVISFKTLERGLCARAVSTR